ncbi:MAG: hypothetical protein DSY66_05725 [Persephonella sp.]|nr:MAG: hypothetical protein DSY66_05725 [Persephonella sp.]
MLKNIKKFISKILNFFKIFLLTVFILLEIISMTLVIIIYILSENTYISIGKDWIYIYPSHNTKIGLYHLDIFNLHTKKLKITLNDKFKQLNINGSDLDIDLNFNPLRIKLKADNFDINLKQIKIDKKVEKFEYPQFLKYIPRYSKLIQVDVKRIEFNYINSPNNIKLKTYIKDLYLKNNKISGSVKFNYDNKVFANIKSITGFIKNNKFVLNPFYIYLAYNIKDLKGTSFENLFPKKIRVEKSFFDFSNFNLNVPLSAKNKRLDLKVLISGDKKNIYIRTNFYLDKFNFKDLLTVSQVYGNVYLKSDFENLFILNNRFSIDKLNIKPSNIEINGIKGDISRGNISNPVKKIILNVDSLLIKNIPINFRDIKSDSIKFKGIKVVNNIDLKNKVISGRVELDNKNFKYLFNQKDNFIDIKIPRIYSGDLFKYFQNLSKKSKELENYINLYLYGDISINLKENIINTKFNLNDVYLYGLKYKNGLLNGKIYFGEQFSIKPIILRFVNNNNSFIMINGSIDKNSLDLLVNSRNLELSKIRFINDKNITLLTDLNGTVSGKTDNLKANFKIDIKNASYDNTKLHSLSLNLKLIFKDKNLYLNAFKEDIDLSLDFNLLKGKGEFSVETKNLNLKKYLTSTKFPEFLNKALALTRISGSFNLSFNLGKQLDISFNSKNINLKINKYNEKIDLSLKGWLKGDKISLNFAVKNKSSKEAKIFEKLYIKGKFQNNELNTYFELKGKEFLKKIYSNGDVKLNINDKIIKKFKVNLSIPSQVAGLTVKPEVEIYGKGSFDKIDGIVKSKLSIGKYVSKNSINYSIERKNNLFSLSFNSESLNFLYNKFSIKTGKISGKIFTDFIDIKAIGGNLLLDGVYINGLNKKLIYLGKTEIIFKKGKISIANPISIKGVIDGKILTLRYDLLQKDLNLQIIGKLNKDVVSDLIAFGGIDGDLRIYIEFNGNILNYKDNLKLKVVSNNLEIKSSDFRRPIYINNLKIVYRKGGLVNIDIYGNLPSNLYGQGSLRIKGNINLNKDKNFIIITLSRLPVRYKSIFTGYITTRELVIKFVKSNKKDNWLGYDIYINGDIFYSGRLRINKEFQKLVSTEGKRNKKIESLKKFIHLNLSVSTDNPLVIRGVFGRAVAISKIRIMRTAYKPVINGFIKILGGKINFMKIKYGINKLEINISNNEARINAQLSTFLYDTKIFINIFGNIKKPNVTFISQPPKSQEEIMSMLFLKDLPSALAGLTTDILPLLKDLGALLSKMIPTEDEDTGEGVFNTGVEISIRPEYSPTEGLVPFIYAKRNITSRIYLAISRALTNSETYRNSGWYEIGVRLGSDINMRYRIFENKNEEFEFILSTQFDF